MLKPGQIFRIAEREGWMSDNTWKIVNGQRVEVTRITKSNEVAIRILGGRLDGQTCTLRRETLSVLCITE